MTPPPADERPAGSPASMQEIIGRRQQTGFIGRQDELERFRENFVLPPDDVRHRFLFNVYGDPGVGKTFLVHQLCRVAEEQFALCAYTDAAVYDIPSAMAAVAAELRRQGERLKALEDRLDAYDQRRHELELDPHAPEGASSVLARIALTAGLRAARAVPLLGAAAVMLDADTLIEQADRLRTFLTRKFRSREDVRLLLEPTEQLSQVFVAELRRASARRPVALFFDAYEQTAPLLDTWLRNLVEGRYGELPANLTITVAGQHSLDANRWAAFLGEVAHMGLAVFTVDEARQLLARKYVRDERVVQVILALSGRLPLLLAMLAEGSPDDPAAVGDPTGSAVERVLEWEREPLRRAAALTAALPRQLDEDVLAALLDVDDASELFAWLRSLPFVTEQEGHCEYHEVVRAPMLRLLRGRSPRQWQRRHRQLASLQQESREALGLPDEEAWTDPAWQAHRLEETYHRLCADPVAALPAALVGTVWAYRASRTFARRWAATIEEAGRDATVARVQHWGARLLEYARDDDDCWVELLTLLLDQAPLDNGVRVAALTQRAECHAVDRRFEAALADVDSAARLDPGNPRLIADRGETYRLMGRYEDAVQDFDRAIELDPRDGTALASRGVTFRRLGRFPEALRDLSRAVELNPRDEWAVAHRGEVHRRLAHYDEALLDLSRAIELNPSYEWAIGSRGLTYRQMGRLQEAVTDFSRAIELNSEYGWALASRGVTYRQMGRYPEALTDLDRAVELDPDYGWAIAYRGVTYRQTGHYHEALADLSRAIELDSRREWAIANRGVVFRQMGRYPEALADLDRAVELRPESDWAIANRGVVLRDMGRYAEALVDFDRALELDSGNAWVMARRGETLRLLGRYDEAMADFDRVLELHPDDDLARCRRALVLRQQGRAGEAEAELRVATAAAATRLAEKPGDARLLFRLGLCHAAAGDFAQARRRCREALVHGARPEQVHGTVADLIDLRQVAPARELDALIALLQSADVVPD